MSYYFRTQKLSVGYNNCPLIQDIEIGLKKGEILTLIGPNGAGKSTILKSIAGQLALVGGTIYLDGKDTALMTGTQLSRKMAVVLTQRLRTEMMTCEDVVGTGRYPYTGRFGILSDSDHQVIREAMELVHITELKDQDFAKISDGQRQRVMLARAICQEPEIIILDEPTSFLDVKYKLEFLSMIQEMRKKKGLTVIMSLHELELAERVSDKILCVNGMQVDRYGTPEEIFSKGYISGLFGIRTGSFDEENGSAELERPAGPPQVFVIAGGGSGRSVYRKLQRKGISFATGILRDNDLDYPAARALAAEVLVSQAFEPVDQQLIEKGKRLMDACGRVICCRERLGSLDTADQELYQYALERGMLNVQGILAEKTDHEEG